MLRQIETALGAPTSAVRITPDRTLDDLESDLAQIAY